MLIVVVALNQHNLNNLVMVQLHKFGEAAIYATTSIEESCALFKRLVVADALLVLDKELSHESVEFLNLEFAKIKQNRNKL